MNNNIGMLGDILIILGAICIFAGTLCRNYHSSHARYKGRAEATVVEIETDKPDAKGIEQGIHDYFYPVFAWYADGHLIRKRYPYGSNPCSFSLNQKVRIRYKRSDPSVFVLERKSSLEQRAKRLHYVGLALIVAGGIIFILFANRKWLTWMITL